MKTDRRKPKRIVYIVTGRRCEVFHPRIHKLLSLRPYFDRMVLVAKGHTCIDNENLVLKPFSNPTGIFRLMGLTNFKRQIDRCLFFPSTNSLFVKRIKKKLSHQIDTDLDKGKEVCLLTSVPPHDLCQLGLELKTQFPSIKWIVDWRDLWSYDENYFFQVPKLYRNCLIRLEKRIFESCDLNITTNKYAQRILETHYKVPSARTLYINQHFCIEDMPTALQFSRTKQTLSSSTTSPKTNIHPAIKIGFLGTLFKPPRVPGLKLVKVITDLRKNGLNVELHVFGKVSDRAKQSLKEFNNTGLFLYEKMPEIQCVQHVAGCDYLLLLLDDLANSKAVMCLKLPQYLIMGKPILAIVPKSSAIADIIEETGTGYIIPADNDWALLLREILDEPQKIRKPLVRNREAINTFSWENISKQWFNVLSKS